MKTRTLSLAFALVVLAVVAVPRSSQAQGTLSVQGLGYPPGQFSARAMGTDGALGEFDPGSPVNPAALLDFGGAALAVQMAPEFRRITNGSSSSTSSTQRFPVFIGALPLSDKLMVGVSSSTLLDRSWQTTTPQQQILSGDTIAFNSTTTSDGSVNDLALTVAYMPVDWLRLGLAAHAINGRDIVTTRLTFADTVRYGNSVLPITNTFTGNAVSAGLELVDPSLGGIALSYRLGGRFEQTVGDTLIAKAAVPDQFGLGLVFTGFSGTAVAFRTSYDSWSRLGSIDSATGAAMNAWDSSVGAEFTGPKLGDLPLYLRAGARWRDLPFPAEGHQVHEASFSGGIGFGMAQGHARFDLGMVHASRTAGIDISESAWTLNAGLTIRP